MVESRVAATIHAAKKCLFLEIKKLFIVEADDFLNYFL